MNAITYAMQAAIQHTTDVIVDYDRGVFWKERIKVLYQRDTELLLLARRVDICKEQDNIVAAYESHQAHVVELGTLGLFLLLVRSFV